jgi:hypothetical protein
MVSIAPERSTKSHERTQTNAEILLRSPFAAIILRGRLAIADGQFVTNQLSEFLCCFNSRLR